MNLKSFFSRLRHRFSRVDPKAWIITLLILAAAAALLVLLFSKPETDPMDSEEVAAILDIGALRAGVRSDIPSFGVTDETGTHTGLEAELIKLLSAEVFGQDSVDFTVVSYNTLSALLRTRELDVCAAIYQKGMSTSLVYSEPYYTDAVALMVRRDSEYTTADQLKAATIGVINRDGSNMRYIPRNAAYEFTGDTGTVREYSGIPDMMEDLADGTIDAVCMEYALLYSYYSESLHRILPEAIDTISYSFVFQPGSTELAKIADRMLARMREDGSLDALIAKWNLTDYS